MTLTRTEQTNLKPTPSLSSQCHYAKNLYNEANFYARQRFFNYNIAPDYRDMDKLMNGKASEPSENYIQLPAATAQWVLKILNKNWLSFFRSIKDWKKNPNKYKGMPKPPGYLRKDGEFILIFTSNQFKLKDGYIHFPKKTGFIPVKTRITSKINQVRIIPQSVGYKIEIIYEVKQKNLKLNKQNVIGIDLGVVNTATIVDNLGNRPIIIKGGPLKSANQFYNKTKAKLQQLYTTIKLPEKFYGSKLKHLDHKRNNIINDLMHKYSKFIIEHCIANDIGTIVIGKNENWKQLLQLGKHNNQNFIQIPLAKLINKIEYKAENVSIDIILQEESYTSNCSFLDLEPMCYHSHYLGKRHPRGLFTSANGTIINSDVNGAYNILRKAIPKAFSNGIEGLALNPICLNPLTESTYKLNL